MSAEESLKIDLMLELITHLSSAQFAASYMQKDVVKEGILIQDPSGSFTLGGTPLPPMTDIEVYVMTMNWTRMSGNASSSAAARNSGSAV